MKGYKAVIYKGELRLTAADSILFYLSDGDLSKLPALRKSSIKDVYDFYYLRRVQALNKILEEIAQLKS